MSYIEARRGPLSFYSDIFYANLGLTDSGIRSGSVVPAVGGTLGASLGASFELAVIEVGVAYEIARWSRYTAIDLIAGGRYWHQSIDVNFALAGTLNIGGLVLTGDRAIARSGSVDWVDPLIGLRVRHQLAPGQELVLRGDIGGFDVGSEFSWNLMAAYSWQFAVRDGVTYSGLLGYRALSVDYVQGSGANRYEYNVLQHGPIMGLTVGF
jgi:hypothetical protein